MNSDELLAAHVAKALADHRRWCRRSGYRFPLLFEAILDALAASSGPQRPELAPAATGVDPEPVAASWLVGDAAAAQLLGLSERTVRRLRSTGALPEIRVGRRRLIRRADIENFAKGDGA